MRYYGTYIDHKAKKLKLRRIRLTSAAIGGGVILVMYFTLSRIAGGNLSTFEKAHFLGANSIQHGAEFSIAVSYALLIHSVSYRYAVINDLFKFGPIIYHQIFDRLISMSFLSCFYCQ